MWNSYFCFEKFLIKAFSLTGFALKGKMWFFITLLVAGFSSTNFWNSGYYNHNVTKLKILEILKNKDDKFRLDQYQDHWLSTIFEVRVRERSVFINFEYNKVLEFLSLLWKLSISRIEHIYVPNIPIVNNILTISLISSML